MKKEYLDAIEFYNMKRDGLGYEFTIEVDYCINNIMNYSLDWQKLSKRVRRILVWKFQYGIIYNKWGIHLAQAAAICGVIS